MFKRILSVKMVFFYLCTLLIGFLIGYDIALLSSSEKTQVINPNACYSASDPADCNGSADELNRDCFPEN